MARLGKNDIVSIEDLTTVDIERIFELADSFAVGLEGGETLERAHGLIMATLFYEPSTRTRLSFESAMHRLGGAVISSPDMHASSAAKGETLADTVRVVGAYADVIVVRHPRDGAARVAAEYAPCPVINAGDGSREHPTQTLCDLYILRRKKGHLRGLTVAICGDLKFGRTVHSLIYALARFGANIVAVPYNGMNVPEYVLERVAAESKYGLSTVTMEELRSLAGGIDALYLTPNAPHQMALFTSDMPLEGALPAAAAPVALDAFYLTRLQRERMDNKEGDGGKYGHFDVRALKTSRTHEAVVMHPLPRTDELAYELDSDPRAVYFEQAAAGVPVRMALIAWLLEHERNRARAPGRAGACDSLQVASGAALSQPRLYQPPRRSLPGAALSPGALDRLLHAAPGLRVLRARAENRLRRSRAHAALLPLRPQPLWLCAELDRGKLARGVRERQAGRGKRLRAVSARSAARNHERRRSRGGLWRAGRADDRRSARPRLGHDRWRGQPRRDARDAPARSDRSANRRASAVRGARRLRRRSRVSSARRRRLAGGTNRSPGSHDRPGRRRDSTADGPCSAR